MSNSLVQYDGAFGNASAAIQSSKSVNPDSGTIIVVQLGEAGSPLSHIMSSKWGRLVTCFDQFKLDWERLLGADSSGTAANLKLGRTVYFKPMLNHHTVMSRLRHKLQTKKYWNKNRQLKFQSTAVTPNEVIEIMHNELADVVQLDQSFNAVVSPEAEAAEVDNMVRLGVINNEVNRATGNARTFSDATFLRAECFFFNLPHPIVELPPLTTRKRVNMIVTTWIEFSNDPNMRIGSGEYKRGWGFMWKMFDISMGTAVHREYLRLKEEGEKESVLALTEKRLYNGVPLIEYVYKFVWEHMRPSQFRATDGLKLQPVAAKEKAPEQDRVAVWDGTATFPMRDGTPVEPEVTQEVPEKEATIKIVEETVKQSEPASQS